MSTSKSSIVEKSSKHSVSPIRDVLLVPPGALQTREENAESIHTHPALLVEERIISEVKPKSISTTPSSRTTNTGNNIATPIKEHELPKKTVSPKTKKEGKRRVKRRGNRKRTRHAGGGSGTRKKYNRKLRTTRGRKR
jgi:long-subunit acyl-CoA synthetase (AMP-forming)